MSSVTNQILLYLYDCIDYGFSYRLKKGLFILDEFPSGWKKVNKKQIRDGIRDLNKLKFVQKKEKYDGSVIVSLTNKGRLRALNISFRNFNNRKEKWDGKWRMVAFDIPDECKRGRNALRYRLKIAGFYELQESLFLYPYDCEKEVKDFIELFKLEKYVRFALLNFIDNEKEIKTALGID
ncbi:MAG: PaaX family transcrtiptional regulator [Parcubacteria group bacterium Licking1014_1]|nr:MAG: PaaX family transcrtiptional regulator [Parcubacteria group bacterium Licking1014_1]